MEPPFRGFIETTYDSLLVFEAARRGLIPRVTRRLQERERFLVQSGAVFVFDEQESGIKRWTDGLIWSPSRILGNFLVYRETDKPRRAAAQAAQAQAQAAAAAAAGTSGAGAGQGQVSPTGGPPLPSPISSTTSPHPVSPTSLPSQSPSYFPSGLPTATEDGAPVMYGVSLSRPRSSSIAATEESDEERARERALVGSLTKSDMFKVGGLVKKTMSLTINGSAQHLVSYYTLEDVQSGRLRTPSSLPELASLPISPEYLVKTNFRVPVRTERDENGILQYRGEAEDISPMPTSPIIPTVLPPAPSGMPGPSSAMVKRPRNNSVASMHSIGGEPSSSRRPGSRSPQGKVASPTSPTYRYAPYASPRTPSQYAALPPAQPQAPYNPHGSPPTSADSAAAAAAAAAAAGYYAHQPHPDQYQPFAATSGHGSSWAWAGSTPQPPTPSGPSPYGQPPSSYHLPPPSAYGPPSMSIPSGGYSGAVPTRSPSYGGAPLPSGYYSQHHPRTSDPPQPAVYFPSPAPPDRPIPSPGGGGGGGGAGGASGGAGGDAGVNVKAESSTFRAGTPQSMQHSLSAGSSGDGTTNGPGTSGSRSGGGDQQQQQQRGASEWGASTPQDYHLQHHHHHQAPSTSQPSASQQPQGWQHAQ